ncbi:MAG: hypothetical protein AAB342_05265 [Chloroflexota bacterium]
MALFDQVVHPWAARAADSGHLIHLKDVRRSVRQFAPTFFESILRALARSGLLGRQAVFAGAAVHVNLRWNLFDTVTQAGGVLGGLGFHFAR